MTSNDPLAPWPRPDSGADDPAYVAQRNRLVADAALGDPGEADEPRMCGGCMQYEPNCTCARSDDDDDLQPDGREDVTNPGNAPEVRNEWDDRDDELEDEKTFNARLYAFLEDVRDYLRAKPACENDSEAEELIGLAEEFMERYV